MFGVFGDRKWRNNGDKKWRRNLETESLFIIVWRIHIWSVSRVETYEVLDVPGVWNLDSVCVT